MSQTPTRCSAAKSSHFHLHRQSLIARSRETHRWHLSGLFSRLKIAKTLEIISRGANASRHILTQLTFIYKSFLHCVSKLLELNICLIIHDESCECKKSHIKNLIRTFFRHNRVYRTFILSLWIYTELVSSLAHISSLNIFSKKKPEHFSSDRCGLRARRAI